MGVAMPSWNIHIAQTERLLERSGALANSVRDRNAFLFGCVVPDIFVGYMVPGIADPIPYRITHFAKPELSLSLVSMSSGIPMWRRCLKAHPRANLLRPPRLSRNASDSIGCIIPNVTRTPSRLPVPAL